MAKLTNKQNMFVQEYLIDLNATQAAIRAGYSPKTANEQGARLLANVSVKAAIDIELAARSKRTGITQDRVLRELAKIGFSDISSIMEWSDNGIQIKSSNELTKDDTACIQEIIETETQTKDSTTRKIKFKLYDKKSALVDLGKHLGLFNDKVDISGEVTYKVKLPDDI